MPVIKYYSDDLRKIISMMLVVDPNKRATVDEILNSEIMRKQILKARKSIITNEIKIGKN